MIQRMFRSYPIVGGHISSYGDVTLAALVAEQRHERRLQLNIEEQIYVLAN